MRGGRGWQIVEASWWQVDLSMIWLAGEEGGCWEKARVGEVCVSGEWIFSDGDVLDWLYTSYSSSRGVRSMTGFFLPTDRKECRRKEGPPSQP